MARPDISNTRLVVLSGAHKGALIRLSDGNITVGGTTSCDAVLRDDSVGASSVCLGVDETGRVAVSDCVGDVRVGSATGSPNRTMKLGSGVPLHIGDVRLALGASEEDALTQVSARSRRGVLLRWGTGAAMVMLFSSAIGMTGGAAKTYFPKLTPPPASYASLTTNRTGATVAALEGEIIDAGLYTLTIDRFPGQRLVAVSGTLPSADEVKWREIVRWFDGKYGTVFTLQSNVRFEDKAIVMPFSIQSVVLSPWPHVVLHDGKRVELGMAVPGGWTIESINETHIAFAKDTKTLAVKY